MRIPPPRHDRGIALIIVMMVILVLSVLAGGFAYSMKVETKLARNTAYDSDMEWLGRSGVELGKYALAMQLASPPPENQYFALNQVWAGGPGNPTNDLTADIQLKGVKLGDGKIDVSIVDMERKFSLAAINNENSAGVLERALTMVGADSGDIPTIIDSYLDWIDADQNSHLAGAENPFYLRLNPPYFAKNGPVDDIRELLLIKGMTEEVFWGAKRMGVNPEARMRKRTIAPVFNGPENQQTGVGLFDLFTPFHGAAGRVNVNTAPVEVLQILPGVDPAMASAIVGLRSEEPFHNVGELANVPGIDPVTMGAMQSFFTVQSRVFEITVDAEISNYRRRFVALVHLDGPRQVTTLYFTWR